ncbi:uncharacterized protein CDAR_250351 [Caerostris darwini]|uniref:Gustatory receptor n=1 Tax=Caerostris darwini TaxID=1538125 RepID=A0AAV4UME3_9ARAC|nr:uncharacterized protein CDAR_250351 [Caerostris darwini]
MISSLIFITISIVISKEQSLSSDLVTVFTAWNFVVSVYMFYQVTMSGSAVYEELKKIGLEYSDEVSQQSLFISKEKDKSMLSFFLLLGSIRDNPPPNVTGGGMFVISKAIFLNMMNALLTYSVVMFQLEGQ